MLNFANDIQNRMFENKNKTYTFTEQNIEI